MSQPLLRLVSNTTKSKTKRPSKSYTLHLSCHVKPNALAKREGVVGVDDQVRVCVSAVPKDGEANAAVSKVIAGLLGVPKSNVQVIRGQKSRDKTVGITALQLDGSDEDQYLARMKKVLEDSVIE